MKSPPAAPKVTVRFETVTPSAEAAEKAYEPILEFVCPFDTVCVPTAVFAATVSEFDAKVKALPDTPLVPAVAAESIPWMLLAAAAMSDPWILVKFVFATDWISPFKESTRVVFAGMM